MSTLAVQSSLSFILSCIGDVLNVNACAIYSPEIESMTREAVMAPVRECLRAAAILKKKAGKAKQQSGAESSHVDEQKREEDIINSTRESLLNSFRYLRPVTSKDFGDGIAFFLGEQQENISFSHSRHAHYDSSSSEEEEEVDTDE